MVSQPRTQTRDVASLRSASNRIRDFQSGSSIKGTMQHTCNDPAPRLSVARSNSPSCHPARPIPVVAYARRMNALVVVSTTTLSPTFTNGGTVSRTPFSSTAGL